MPGQEGKIETRCPACGAKYRVPEASEGHHARCLKCQTRFLVARPEKKQPAVEQFRPPTEDDIMQWLNEGADDEFIAPRPRIVSGGDLAPPQPGPESPARQAVSMPDEPRNTQPQTILDTAGAKGPRRPLRKTG